MKEVRWTQTAIRTLQETSDFVLQLWNIDVVEAFLEQLDSRIKLMQSNPELAPKFDNTQIRKLIIHNTVSLFYVNTPQFIKILVIWDNRQNADKLLHKLKDADRN